MTYTIWLLLSGAYLMFTWAAGRRGFAEAALCFFDGIYLAMLCFALLPLAMEAAFFYQAAACAAMGVALGLLTEGRLPKENALRAVLFAALAAAFYLLQGKELVWAEAVLLAFFGGMGLYHASAGILPEPVCIRKAILSAGGFLLGAVYFSPLL